jgi:acetoin utilization deacetylase AcuC-like enzyme
VLVGEIISGGFETLRGDKTHRFISTTRSFTKMTKTLKTRALFSF